jgi:hypothetical protein
MSISIVCSARRIKTVARSFDKTIDEGFPHKYWFRIKFTAKGKMHRGCIGHITGMWFADGNYCSGFDSVVMALVSEPPLSQREDFQVTPSHYRTDIPNGASELAGLLHVKLNHPSEMTEEEQQKWDAFPEVQVNRSRTESNYKSKKFIFPYGGYYMGVDISDSDGYRSKKIFYVHCDKEKGKCYIRPSWFYERVRLFFKSFLPA